MSSNLQDYIVIIEDALPNELCDEVIAEYCNDVNWELATIDNGRTANNIRNCDAIDMSNPHIISQNVDTRTQIDSKLFKCAANTLKQYRDKFIEAKAIVGDSGYTLLRYKEGGFYTRHTDHFLKAPRSISCSFALNDDYEGGEWNFFTGAPVKIKKGAAILFPSNFMYPHEILPVTSGTRYSIITWFI